MGAIIEKTWTINDIKTAARVAGSHWFDPDSMRFFKCRVLPDVFQGPGGIFFVSSEKFSDESPRKYSVRKFTPEGAGIDTVGEFQGFDTPAQARYRAEDEAGIGSTRVADEYKPVTDAEQFLDDLHKAGYTKADAAWCKHMIALHTKHGAYCVQYCNTGAKVPPAIKTALRKHAAKIGVGVLLGGDPRGCVTKIVAENLPPNDWGKEGYCVPRIGQDDD